MNSPEATREPAILLALAVAALVITAIHPHDTFTWFLEVAPILIAVPILILTRRRFPLTPLAYRLLFVHALILMLGGHYTYAEVPIGFWVGKALGFSRNHYDRLGHFAQGFVPAIIAREILLRRSPLRPGRWLFFLVTCVCLAVSATYELVEWWTALVTGEGATAFLGTQGDPWDTQWDMFLALVGALSALAFLSRLHDRQLAALSKDGYTVTP
jgi:putative membrane protein